MVWLLIGEQIGSIVGLNIAVCVGGHNSTPYLNVDLDISDLQVATPHNLELLEGNSQIAD